MFFWISGYELWKVRFRHFLMSPVTLFHPSGILILPFAFSLSIFTSIPESLKASLFPEIISYPDAPQRRRRD
jgi:hypothetical protein